MGTTGSCANTELAPAPDKSRLSRYITSMMPSLGPVDVLERMAGGLSNPTFLVRGPGGSAVLRTKPARASDLLPSAHAIEREFAVMQALASAGFPVPRMLARCDDEEVIGVAFYLMEHVEGRIVRDPAMSSIPVAERRGIYDAMNATMADLHGIDPAQVGLDAFGAQGNYLERQVRRWTKQYMSSATETVPAMDRLMAWLPQHLPDARERRIVHGDFRLENLILHPSAPRVLAVIDWELSTVGDPVADFAYHCLPWHMPRGEAKGIGMADPSELGIPSEHEYRLQYATRTGRSIDDAWHVYIAFNFFRLAAILQGVYRRGLEGRGTSEAASRAGARARAMAELGWEHAQRGRPNSDAQEPDR